MKVLLVLLSFLLMSCKEATVTEDFHYVYLNWADANTSNTMQVNITTTKESDQWQIVYRLIGGDEVFKMSLAPSKNDDLKGVFYLHFSLSQLKAGSVYEFFIEGQNYQGPVYRFKTFAKDEEHLRFVVGGDTGAGEKFAILSDLAKSTNFDFAVFGGDIAYANGDIENYRDWMNWLEIWTRASNHNGMLKPFIVAIGNHETNYNFFLSKRQRAPFYFNLFEQDKRTYFRREIAGNNFLILDTGHISSYSEQKEFIQQNTFPSIEAFQFSFYHIPFFPGHRSFRGTASMGRNSWMNLLEEGGIDVSFEHHDHVLKRTFPLKNLEQNEEEGIVYLGDGAMGKSTRELNNEWYLEKAYSENHFWLVDMYKKEARFEAIGFEGEVLDQFEKKID